MDDLNKDSQQVEVSKAEKPASERKFVSVGTRIHHWSSYLSIDWVYNAAAGATFAYWGKFTELGQRIWSKPVNNFFTKTLTPVFKNNEAHLAEAVKQGNTFASIIAGGMFTIPPLLILENKKVKKSIVSFIDRHVYGKTVVETDPKFKRAYDELDQAPKKDFTMGMVSRFAALAPLLALVLIKPTNEWLKKNFFSHVGSATKTIATKIGLTESRLFKKFPEAERASRWNYVHDEAIAMDLSFGLPYAVLHSFFYNKCADLEDKWQHPLKNRKKGKPTKSQVVKSTNEALSGPAQQIESLPLSEKMSSTLANGYVQKIASEAEASNSQQLGV